MSKQYTKNLESIVNQYFQPLRFLPLSLLPEILLGYKVIPFDKKDKKDKIVLEKLSKIAEIAGNEINKKGILRPKLSEIENDIEIFIKDALNSIGYISEAHKIISESSKTVGYPDLQFIDDFGRKNYLKYKIFTVKNINKKQKSFFASSSEDFKVTGEIHHFILSYATFIAGRKGNNNIYKCESWKILSVEHLEINVKYEINSYNARIYADEIILAEGKLG